MFRFIISLFIFCYIKAEAQHPSALTIADSLYAVGNYTKAIYAYEKIKPRVSDISLKIARAYQAKGNYDGALLNFAKAAAPDNDIIAKNEYGKLLTATSRYKKADSIFSVLINNYNQNPDFYYQRGIARMKIPLPKSKEADSIVAAYLANKKKYISDFEQAVTLDSTHQKALYETSKFYLQQKDFPRMEKLAFKALESYPDNVEIISLLAQENFMRGFCTDAIKWFNKLLDLGQETQFIHEHLGMCYYKNRQYELAITQYLSVLDYDDEDWYTHENLSKLYNHTGKYTEAEKHAKLALEYKDLPLDDNYYTLANTYKLSKKFKEAMTYLNKCLQENTDHKKARYAKAVVADNYYEDRDEVLQLYTDFIKRYDDTAYAKYDPELKLAKERAAMIKKEIFMEKGNTED